MNCAPNKNRDKKDHTCYSKEQLIKIAQALNKKKKSKINTSKTKNEIWEQIRQELFDECLYEWCWLDNKHVKELNDKDLRENVFKPSMPGEWMRNRYTWLNTTDISKVMRQYEKLYEDFRFFGPVPVDCPRDIYCELTDIDLVKLRRRGVNYVGVIYNLDRHDQGGSHWVAVFVNMVDRVVSYYDSTGSPPPDYIRYFMGKMERGMGEGRVEVNWNRKRHQYGGSECGVYSMNFLVESLKGKKMSDFQKKKIDDFSVNILRNYFYRPSNKKWAI